MNTEVQNMKSLHSTQEERYKRNVSKIGEQFQFFLKNKLEIPGYDYYDLILFEPKKKPNVKSIVLVAVSSSQLVLFDGDNCNLLDSKNPRVEFIKNSSSEWFIEQIHTSQNSNNQGNVLMEYFLKYAKENNVSYITGELLPDPEKEGVNHWKRLQSYYEKYGFTVTWYSNKHNRGEIKYTVK